MVIIFLGIAPPTALVQSSLVRIKQDPARIRQLALAKAAGCPQMENPGGKLAWNPRPDAGPVPTDGTVVLPTLGVRAPVVRVGVGSDGNMVVPTNARDVAWFDQGPLPGRTNNIVLAGHIDYNGVWGSFGNIENLKPGDTVALTFGNKVWAFQVDWSCLFDFNSPAPVVDLIMGYTDNPSITLISCGGVFNSAAGTHDKRVAVRGELIKTV